MFPIVWNAVNTNIKPNPNKITFKNLLSSAILENKNYLRSDMCRKLNSD